jgi:O-antigen chain-terminating methyltransferase
MSFTADTTDAIDVEKIMEEIRREIDQRGYENNLPAFDKMFLSDDCETENQDLTKLSDCLFQLSSKWGISADHPIKSRNGLIGKIIIFCKKLIRKCIRFHVEPIVIEQNENNRLIYECIRELYLFYSRKSGGENRMSELREELLWREKESEILTQRSIQSVQEENKALKANVDLIVAHFEEADKELERLRYQVDILMLENRKMLLLLEDGKSGDK